MLYVRQCGCDADFLHQFALQGLGFRIEDLGFKSWRLEVLSWSGYPRAAFGLRVKVSMPSPITLGGSFILCGGIGI